MAHGKTRMFLKQLFKNPGKTGAIVPSSRHLAVRMLELSAPGPEAVIVEYGPGTGVFTREIISALTPSQKFFCVEINEGFAEIIRRDHPGFAVYTGCASGIGAYCAKEGVDRVDRVISGLPWAVFPEDLQRKILGGMMDVMPKGGVFVTFAYLQGLILPSGRKFKRNLKRHFSTVERSGVVWENVPPAIVYRCVR